jgi:ATP-binding protein involved in chromosome partitioning
VGKSYIAAAVARALAAQNVNVGIVDADLQSPTIARMLAAKAPLSVTEEGIEPARVLEGVRIISSDLLLDDGKPLAWRATAGEAHIWRGSAEAAVLREFLADVRWGSLDVLIVDMPPDAGRLADIALLVGDKLSALAITIPSEESARSVHRALTAARDAGVAILGVVENMSGYACASCASVGPLFTGDAGAQLARSFDVPLLARIPFVAAPAAHAMLSDELLGAVWPPLAPRISDFALSAARPCPPSVGTRSRSPGQSAAL